MTGEFFIPEEYSHPSHEQPGFLEGCCGGGGVKHFTEAKIDTIHNLSLIKACNFVIGNQIGQAEPSFCKSVLAGPDSLVVLPVYL